MMHNFVTVVQAIAVTLPLLTESKSPPNIIFILGDDIGYDDLGFQSGTISTPIIDKLKSESQFIPHYYTQCVCSPTRASLLTGLYPLHHGIVYPLTANNIYGLSTNFTLLPEILTLNGYSSHMVGKWHLGYYKWETTPTFRGFQSWLGFYTGALDYYTHKTGAYDPEKNENIAVYDMHDDIGYNCGKNCSQIPIDLLNKYSTHVFTDRAIEIIKNHSVNASSNEKNEKNPLFLYIAFQTGHYPDSCPQKYIDMNSNIVNNERRLYAGMLTCMDEGIGNITDALSKYGYLDDENGNTMIIFASDNGAPVPMGNVTKDGSNGGFNWPLRGGKDTIWEGGTRVPGFVYATKDIINQTKRGTNYTQLMHVTDWFPTLLAAAGIEYKLNYSLDGVNHWNGITGIDNDDDDNDEMDGNNKNMNDNDKYYKYRHNLYYGYEVNPQLKYIGFRNQSFKLLNQSGGNPTQWYSPPVNNSYNWHSWQMSSGINNINSQAKNDYLLYDILNDPNEYTNIANQSNETNEIVNELLTMMIHLKNTGIPYSKDRTDCPNQTFPVYSSVGAVLFPWC